MGLRKTLNILLNRCGYKITKFSQEPDTSRGFTLYTYLTKNGAFDYEKYRRIQTEGNKKKIGQVWAREENIDFLSWTIRRIDIRISHWYTLFDHS